MNSLGIWQKELGLHNLERRRLMQNTAVVFVSDLCKDSLPCDLSEEDKKQVVYNLGREFHFRPSEKKSSVTME